ncbi:phasin family protein [Arhodomonas sp. SL1]|uniref:phasin family protein n=1 Tax=Arhodomonas sp. SL1 TaxID=3425691 RepID=UPI003F88502A
MTNTNFNQMTEQFEKTVFGPMRTYASMAVDHFEKLTNVQYDAAKAYSEFGIQQMRAALDIKDATDVQSYWQQQQKAAETIRDRVKGDAEKVVALNQEFAEKTQKAVQDNAKTVSEAATSSK